MAATAVVQGEQKDERSGREGNPGAGKTGSKGFGRTEAAHKTKAPERAASGVIVEPVDDGYELLRRLVTEALQEKGKKLSESMLETAIAGDTKAVWALIGLLRPPKQAAAQPARQGRSLAEIWAAEPRWEESSEATAEVGAGSREPEG